MLQANTAWLAPEHWVPHMNRLVLSVQFWIVHSGSDIIVIDTGVGNLKPRAGFARMNRLNTLVPEWLEAAGASPDKVTHVALTHLHIDHVGWCTTWKDGRWTPTFPNATYHFPKEDFRFCESGAHLSLDLDVFGASFLDSVMPIVDAARILSEDCDIEPEVIETLVSSKPDTCAGGGNHHGIEKHHRDQHRKHEQHNLHH